MCAESLAHIHSMVNQVNFQKKLDELCQQHASVLLYGHGFWCLIAMYDEHGACMKRRDCLLVLYIMALLILCLLLSSYGHHVCMPEHAAWAH